MLQGRILRLPRSFSTASVPPGADDWYASIVWVSGREGRTQNYWSGEGAWNSPITRPKLNPGRVRICRVNDITCAVALRTMIRLGVSSDCTALSDRRRNECGVLGAILAPPDPAASVGACVCAYKSRWRG